MIFKTRVVWSIYLTLTNIFYKMEINAFKLNLGRNFIKRASVSDFRLKLSESVGWSTNS